MPHPLLSVAIAVLVLRIVGAQDQRLESSLSKMYKAAGESHEKYHTQQMPVVGPIQSGSYQAPSAYQGNSYQAPPGYQGPPYQAPPVYQSPNHQTPLFYQAPASTTTVCIEVRSTPHSQSPTTTVCGPQVSPHPNVPHGYKEADDSYQEADDSYKEADDSYKEANPGPTRVYPVMPIHTAVIPQSYAVHTVHPPPVLYHDVHPAMYYGHHFRSSDLQQDSSYDSVPNLAPPPVFTSPDASYPPPSYQPSYPPPSYQASYVPPSHQPLVVNCQVQPAPDHHYNVGRASDIREMEPMNDMCVIPSSRYAMPENTYMPRVPTNEPMMPPRASPCLYESQPRAAFIDPMYSRAADQPMLPPQMMSQPVMFQPVQMGNQPMSKVQRQQELKASEQRLAELKSRLGQNTQQLPPQQQHPYLTTSQQQHPYLTTSQQQQPYLTTSQQQQPYQTTSQQQQPYLTTSQQQQTYQTSSQQQQPYQTSSQQQQPYQTTSQQQQPFKPTPQQQPLQQQLPQQQPSQQPSQQQPLQQQQPGGAKDADNPRADALSPPSSPSGQGGPLQQPSQASGPATKPITPAVNQSSKQLQV